MKVSEIELNAATAAKPMLMTIKIKVKNMDVLRARIWLGSRIMIFGAWVIGVGICKIVED